MSAPPTFFRQLLCLHQFVQRRSFYALFLGSALAYLLVAVRVERLRSPHFFWLTWNLILAWIPYLASLWAEWLDQQRPTRPWRLVVPGLLWLVFLPNAPYLVTDFIHIHQTPGLPWLFWYDISLVAVFAWTGCFLGVVSLYAMQRLVARHCGQLLGWLFVLGTAGLCGIGIYLGRLLRWNSWDVVANPRDITGDLVAIVSQPLTHLRDWGVCVLFAAFFLISYLMLTTFRPGAPGVSSASSGD